MCACVTQYIPFSLSLPSMLEIPWKGQATPHSSARSLLIGLERAVCPHCIYGVIPFDTEVLYQVFTYLSS